MGGTIASAYVEIDSNIKALQKDIASIKGHVENSAKHMETRFNTATRAISAMGTAIATIGIARLGNDIIRASTKMDSYNRMLVNVEGSQEKANRRFEEFRKLAKEPVLDPMNLSKYYVGLKSVNVEADLSIKFMKSLANAMAGVGAGNQQFALAMEQFTQMAGKGKVMGDDLRAIANSFPQIRKYLVEAFGTAIPEELEKKGLKAIDVMKGLNAQMEKAPKFAGGAQASQDNFTQSLEMFEASLGKNVLPTISKFLDKLTNLMDSFGKLPESTQKIIGTAGMGGLGLLGIAGALTTINNLLGPVATGLKGLATTQIATSTATSATPALSALFGGGTTKAGAMGATALGMTIPQLMVATLVVTGAAYLGAGLLGKATGGKPTKYVPSDEYTIKKGEAGMKARSAEVFGGLGMYDKSSDLQKGIDLAKKAMNDMTLNAISSYTDWSKFPRADFEMYQSPWGNLPERQTPLPSKQVRPGPYEQGTFPYYNQLSPLANQFQEAISMPYASAMDVNTPFWQPSKASGKLASQTKTFDAKPLNEYGVALEDIAKAEAWLAEESEKLNKEHKQLLSNFKYLADSQITDSITKINTDWEDITESTKKADKAQSVLWQNMKYAGQDAFDSLINNGVDKLFDDFENRNKSAIDEWNAGGNEMGQSWAEFSKDWQRANEANSQSWSDFLKEMSAEFGKMLAEMLVKWAAFKIAQWAINKATGENFEGSAYDSSSSESSMDWSSTGWNHWYNPGSIGDWFTPDSEADKQWKATHSYASGGIAWTPQIAKVAEKEPELIIPLSKVGSSSSGVSVNNMNVYLMDSDIKDPNKLRRLIVGAMKQAQANGEI